MNIADKLQTIAENEYKVYEAGQKSVQDEFWDAYQDNGNRRNYMYAFYSEGWTDALLKPKYDIILGGNTKSAYYAQYMFAYSKITEIPFTLDTRECRHSMQYLRFGAQLNGTFQDCSNLKNIHKLIVAEDAAFENTFYNCSSLEHIGIEGVIGNVMDLSYSPKLTHASLSNVIDKLKDTGNPAGTLYDGVLYHNGGWEVTTFSAGGKFVLGQEYYIEYNDPSMNSSSGTYTAKELYVNGSSVIGCEISLPHPIGYDMTIDIYNGSEDNQLAVYIPETYDSYVEIKILGGIILKLGETNIAKLTDAEIALANNKGWRLE